MSLVQNHTYKTGVPESDTPDFEGKPLRAKGCIAKGGY